MKSTKLQLSSANSELIPTDFERMSCEIGPIWSDQFPASQQNLSGARAMSHCRLFPHCSHFCIWHISGISGNSELPGRSGLGVLQRVSFRRAMPTGGSFTQNLCKATLLRQGSSHKGPLSVPGRFSWNDFQWQAPPPGQTPGLRVACRATPTARSGRDLRCTPGVGRALRPALSRVHAAFEVSPKLV